MCLCLCLSSSVSVSCVCVCVKCLCLGLLCFCCNTVIRFAGLNVYDIMRRKQLVLSLEAVQYLHNKLASDLQ
jgi:hypothetical protein